MERFCQYKNIIFLILFGCLTNGAQAEIKRAKKPVDPKTIKKYVQACPPGTEQFGEGYPFTSKVVCRKPLNGGRFRAEGKYVAWHANGNKKMEGDYIRGDKHGIWTTYQRNGKIKSVDTYYAGKMQSRTNFDGYGRPKIQPEGAKNQQNNRQEKKKKRLSWRFMKNK